MNKQDFCARFAALGTKSRIELMRYYADLYLGAVFPETLREAEERITWMREVELAEAGNATPRNCFDVTVAWGRVNEPGVGSCRCTSQRQRLLAVRNAMREGADFIEFYAM